MHQRDDIALRLHLLRLRPTPFYPESRHHALSHPIGGL